VRWIPALDMRQPRSYHNNVVMKQAHEGDAERLDAVFGALADPIRRGILARLTEGEANVVELTAPFGVSQPAISRHLKVLERAGLVSRTRRRTARLSHLRANPLREATQWLASYREYWDESFDRLDSLLADIKKEGTT
jgi:DNA-binding transcriptional ArsR family regulator